MTVEDASSKHLVSPDKTFTCGFYTFNDTTHAYYFSIWYTNSKEKTVVWTANRDKPVNGHGSRLTLTKHGSLVLTDRGGSIVWATNTSSVAVDRVELLNSGNLVLKNKSGKILWKSFDFPTDTLLPNQFFTENQKLISRISPQVFSPGYFSFYFDIENVLKMVYDGPEFSSVYWPNPDINIFQNGRTSYNGTTVAILDDTGALVSSDGLHFSASDVGLGVKRRLTMDYDGNLRLFSLNDTSGLWTVTWQAVIQQCDVHGLCGRNGICIYTPDPKCSCLPHHEPVNSNDWSKGCKPRFKRGCNDTQFIEIPHVDYDGFDLNFTRNISFNDCRQICLGDCHCEAFKHAIREGLWTCYTKGDLFNGHMNDESLYLRIPKRVKSSESNNILSVSRLACGGGDPKIELLPMLYNDASTRSFKWAYLYSFGVAIGAIEVVLFVSSWCIFFRKHGTLGSLEEGYRTISSQFRSFSYGELKRATEKFKQVLGEGGFGSVYKGVLSDERVVAVKKLEKVVQGEEEFWAEVSTFGRINHMNLARMWGFCSEGIQRLLVYEYVENGSLDKHLFSSSTTSTLLEWEKRYKIALGTAKGLQYLHHECLEWVIHCDVKPENILLDSDFEPKISDFGLAKLCQRDSQGLSQLSMMRGTKGYMAPEWTTNLPLTSKVDVYSYGVVILELVRGLRLSSWVVDDNVKEEEMLKLKSFVRFAQGKMQDGGDSWIDDLVDSRLEGKFCRNQAVKMIEIGLLCVEDDRNKRPTMESVAQALAECEDEVVTM